MEIKDKEFHRVVSTAIIHYKWATLAEAKNYDLIEGLLEEMEMADKIIKGEDSAKVEFDYKRQT